MNIAAKQSVELSNAEGAASVVFNMAMNAAAQGTFAVGGCIVDNKTGTVIHAMHNNVLKPLKGTKKVFTYDPTAHGERQLVYWYYQNKDALNLPEPKDLTVVTSLDPCAMCTGALLTAGFNVAVVAIDDYAGINYNESFEFLDLPENLRKQAKLTFGYYACGDKLTDPSMFVREYVGGKNVVFNDSVVTAKSLVANGDIFQASVNTVRDNSSESGRPPSEMSDPKELPDNSPIIQAYRAVYKDAFKMQIAESRFPDQKLYDQLNKIKKATPGAKNAVAFIDPFGNVVLCMADLFDMGPVYTAFMQVTQQYAINRYELMNDPSTRADAEKYLTHPKYGTFVFLHAPDPSDSTTIMTLGAYGSTLEGPADQPFPVNFQYFTSPLNGTIEELSHVIINLPPFYSLTAQLSIAKTAIDVK